MDISIIIVNWNSAEYVRKCLSSLFAHTSGVEHEIIVVDNGSFDSCGSMIAHDFPVVQFLQSSENRGFAWANNFGAERANGEFLLFLNPDTEVIDNAVFEMLTVLKTQPKAGIIGCKLLNSDMTTQISCIQPFPTILNQMLDADVFLRRFHKRLGLSPLFSNEIYPVEVQVISGACMMITKSIFRTVGGFSSEYFMYTEDIDLCYKVYNSGYKNYYTGAVTVIHHGGGSSQLRNENSYANVQMRESIYKFLKKTRGSPYAFCFKSSIFLTGIIRLCILSLASIPSVISGQCSKYNPSIIKWLSILRWSIGIQKWAK